MGYLLLWLLGGNGSEGEERRYFCAVKRSREKSGGRAVAGPLNIPAARARRDTSRALWKVLDHASGDRPAAEGSEASGDDAGQPGAVGAVGVGDEESQHEKGTARGRRQGRA